VMIFPILYDTHLVFATNNTKAVGIISEQAAE
jgi:hypothetical protein